MRGMDFTMVNKLGKWLLIGSFFSIFLTTQTVLADDDEAVEPTIVPWPAWYKRNVVNTLATESDSTLLIAVESIPRNENIPEYIIEVLARRLAQADLDQNNRDAIVSTLLAVGIQRDLDTIVPLLLPNALKDANSTIWELVHEEMSADQYALHKLAISALSEKNPDSEAANASRVAFFPVSFK